MFKEKYKLDNERITPSNELLNSLKEKMKTAQEEMTTKKKNTILVVAHKYKNVAAILVLFILSFSTYEIVKQNQLFTTPKDMVPSSGYQSSDRDTVSSTESPKRKEVEDYKISEDKKKSATISKSKSATGSTQSGKNDTPSSSSASVGNTDTATNNDSTDTSDAGSSETIFGITSESADQSLFSESTSPDARQEDPDITANSDTDSSLKDSESDTLKNSNTLLATSNNPFTSINDTDISSITAVYSSTNAESSISKTNDIATILSSLKDLELTNKYDQNNSTPTVILSLTLHLTDNSTVDISIGDSAIKSGDVWYTVSSKISNNLQNLVASAIK